MATMPYTKDKYGRPVTVGCRVRILELSPSILAPLPQEELEEVLSMAGEVFEVYEVDEYGCAWVEKGWHFPEQEQYMSHSIGLESHEMELIDDKAL